MELLHLNMFQKAQATNAIKQAFPIAKVLRKGSRSERVTFYEGIGHKTTLTTLTPETSYTLSDVSDSPEVKNIKKLIADTSSELESVNKKLDDHISGENVQKDVVKTLLRMQTALQARIQEWQDCLTSLMQKEINRLVRQKSSCQTLCADEVEQLNKELDTFIKYLNINIQSKNLSEEDFTGIFSFLACNVRDTCPLLYSILDNLLLHTGGGRNVSEIRVRGAVHSLAILISLRNQKIQNDFKLMFTCLCISFGAGCRFIGMLNHLGLTVSWRKAMDFFDKRSKNQQEDITQLTPAGVPVILLIDNINIYRGKKKHLRLFKSIGPTMWNFTAQALLIPNVDGMDDILKDKKACLSPQSETVKIEADDIFLESDEKKTELFTSAVDRYLLDIIDCAVKIPWSAKQLKEMSEQQLNNKLKTGEFETNSASKYNITVPKEADILTSTHGVKSNVHILPLSLEDNSTILGTMSILDKLTDQFKLPSEKKDAQYVPFDSVNNNFDVVTARSHFELLLSQRVHATSIQETVSQIRAREKAFDDVTECAIDGDPENRIGDEEDEQEGLAAHRTESTTLATEKRRFELEDKAFWDVYATLLQKQLNANATNSEESYILTINNETNRTLALTKDHLQRSLLHVAIERKHDTFAKFLVDLGLNVNDREGCGMTPLNIAVLQANTVLCKFLVESGAQYSGPLFTSIPSPLVMAKTMHLEHIQRLFEEDNALSDEENLLIQEIDGTFHKISSTLNADEEKETKRDRTCSGFITPVVGDVGTCKTNNAAMFRSASYRWVGLCPGDLHNKGYFCEAVFKVHGSSGFHCILVEIMKRKRLTKDVFKKKKFDDNNLVKVREAIADACRAYGIAAALEFISSDTFPTSELDKTESIEQLLLTKFKEWLINSGDADAAFQHRATAFLVYGPLQQLYDAATAYGDGMAREAVYQVQIPIYAQLGFRNYYTEVFRHVINFLSKWPKATRVLLQRNCCINLLGKKGHGIELDAFVEAEVVQPLKNYVSGHTTVNMCERLMANLDMMKYLRRCYMSKEGFDVHPTSRHSVQSSLPDQLKGAWFCLKRGFFENKGRQEVEHYPLENNGDASGKISKNLICVQQKGREKIKQNFKAKLYDCFPDLRYTILKD